MNSTPVTFSPKPENQPNLAISEDMVEHEQVLSIQTW